MAKIVEVKPENRTDHPYDNGAIASVASAEVAVGAAIGGTMGAVGRLIVAEEMDHPNVISPKKAV
jgi:hypothetical protein